MKCLNLPMRITNDVMVASRDDENQLIAGYMNLPRFQQLQIFRTSFHTNLDEEMDGTWKKKAAEVLERHLRTIDMYLEHGRTFQDPGVQEGTRIVGEGSGPESNGFGLRLMCGLDVFKEKPGYDESWTPGLMALRGREIKLMAPYPLWDAIHGCDTEYARQGAWISEVALGFLEDGGTWGENTLEAQIRELLGESFPQGFPQACTEMRT